MNVGAMSAMHATAARGVRLSPVVITCTHTRDKHGRCAHDCMISGITPLPANVDERPCEGEVVSGSAFVGGGVVSLGRLSLCVRDPLVSRQNHVTIEALEREEDAAAASRASSISKRAGNRVAVAVTAAGANAVYVRSGSNAQPPEHTHAHAHAGAHAAASDAASNHADWRKVAPGASAVLIPGDRVRLYRFGCEFVVREIQPPREPHSAATTHGSRTNKSEQSQSKVEPSADAPGPVPCSADCPSLISQFLAASGSQRLAASLAYDASPCAPGHHRVASAASTPADDAECCAICRETLGVWITEGPKRRRANIGQIPCGHKFCFQCIERWAEVTNHCPMCKQEFTEIIELEWTGTPPRWRPTTERAIQRKRQRMVTYEDEDRALAMQLADGEAMSGNDDDDDDGYVVGHGYFVPDDGGGDSDSSSTDNSRTETDGEDETAELARQGGCKKCGSGRRADVLLICDGCEANWHTFCLDPPLDDVPPGLWLCAACEDEWQADSRYRHLPRSVFVVQRRRALDAGRVSAAAASEAAGPASSSAPVPPASSSHSASCSSAHAAGASSASTDYQPAEESSHVLAAEQARRPGSTVSLVGFGATDRERRSGQPAARAPTASLTRWLPAAPSYERAGRPLTSISASRANSALFSNVEPLHGKTGAERDAASLALDGHMGSPRIVGSAPALGLPRSSTSVVAGAASDSFAHETSWRHETDAIAGFADQTIIDLAAEDD